MPLADYRKIILERMQRTTGVPVESHSLEREQWSAISHLTEVLRQATILEEMIKVETRRSRSLSSRISSKFSPDRKNELEETLSSLEALKENIWTKCDKIAAIAARNSGRKDVGEDSQIAVNPARPISCKACGGILTIVSYNNFQCQNCGLGYSAKDYLENLNDSLQKI